MKPFFVGLQTLATICVPTAVELFRNQQYVYATLTAAVGIAAYIVYEYLPEQSPESQTQSQTESES